MATLSKLRLIIATFLLAFAVVASAKTYIVAAGVADYPGTEQDLQSCDNDANAIAWLYKQNCGAEYALMTNERATCSRILTKITELFSKAGKDDIVIFYFSGHGYPGGFNAYDGELSFARVRKAMATSKAKNKIIFGDSCFSGKMRAQGQQEATKSDKKANVMLFLSSRSTETSAEYRQGNRGMFTIFLEKGLKGAADTNGDRTITAKELFRYVSNGVKELSGDTQHPVMWGSFPDDMPVITW